MSTKKEKSARKQSEMETQSSGEDREQLNPDESRVDKRSTETRADPSGQSDSTAALGPEERIEQLELELQEAHDQADENLNGWQRALAEFSNFKKRTERDNNETRSRLKGEILLPLLDVLDDLKLALLDKPNEGDGSQWATGIEMIFLKFQAQIQNMEVEMIDQKGVPFDPNLHEAITYEESDDVEEGYVIDVFQSGYRIGERVIRPARVRVAR